MSLSFLPKEIRNAIGYLNYNYISEIRLRQGQPVIVEYRGKYGFLCPTGITKSAFEAIKAEKVSSVLNSATGGSVYSFCEQMKSGFITVEHGVRIGIAGEYVTQNGFIISVGNLTSLNIRIPHDVDGCADFIFEELFSETLNSVLIFSVPGAGKTTMLRALIKRISRAYMSNILVFDERNEIAALDGEGNGFNLGCTVDVVRSADKISVIPSSVRAMKPQLIVTDELYGEKDVQAVKYAVDCGICVVASSHITDKNILKNLPFGYFVELTGIGETPLIYDKNFNSYRRSGSDDYDRRDAFGG